MTEEEAKTKWCPHVRFVVDNPSYAVSAGNKYSDGAFSVESCCMASDCMMWMTQPIRIENSKSELIRIEEHGYCGIGGFNGN